MSVFFPSTMSTNPSSNPPFGHAKERDIEVNAAQSPTQSQHETPEVEKVVKIDQAREDDHMYSQILAKKAAEVPQQYFFSAQYILTMISMSLVVVSTYFGFAVPASVVTFINADIGKSLEATTGKGRLTRTPPLIEGWNRTQRQCQSFRHRLDHVLFHWYHAHRSTL